ncbi:hypothetical protein AY599_14240 [Leptolyngbya valderiana BDU 20041]|nr:hypothetical protein AY599_14240 [Leptolyngbya valderiana BDU 20041]
MNEASQIIYPTFTLFLYDLQEELGQDAEKIRRNRHRFWRKIDADLDRDYEELDEGAHRRLDELATLEKPEATAVELFAEAPDGKRSLEDDLDGYLYALQLGDTYALQVNYAGKVRGQGQPDFAAKSLDRLPEMQRTMLSLLDRGGGDRNGGATLSPAKQGNIGQTWLLWAKLPGNHPESSQVARACRQQLVPEGQWEKPQSTRGRFAGANLYEVWQAPLDWEHPGRENQHLLLLLFPPRQTLDGVRQTMETLYPHLLRLCCYRNKIVWAYSRSRGLKRQLKADYIEIETIAAALGAQLRDRDGSSEFCPLVLDRLREKLVETLELSARYARHLNDLDHQARTIRANSANYTQQVKKIAELDADSQLDVLSEFADGPAETYRLQIETDLARFAVGSELLQNVINTLNGAIDLQQANPIGGESERLGRDVTTAFVSVGVGIATTQATSLAWAAQSLKADKTTVSPFFGLLLSLVTGLVGGAIAWKLCRSR